MAAYRCAGETRMRIRKNRIDPATRKAREIGLPEAQNIRGDFTLHDIANHSEADQRHMVRSGKRETIRRYTKIEKLERAGVIDKREALACEWYATAHAMRFDTVGITARYGCASGGGCTNFDHLPKTREQEEAFRNFEFARQAINPFFLPMFERVVLHGRPLGKLAITFRTVARQLLRHIEGRVAL